MKAPSFDNAKAFALLAAVGLIAYVGYRVYKTGTEVVTKDLNPANPENIVNKAVSSVAENIFAGKDTTGAGYNADGSWSVGGYLYDVFNRGKVKERDSFTAPPSPSRAITYPKSGM